MKNCRLCCLSSYVDVMLMSVIVVMMVGILMCWCSVNSSG